MPKQEAIHYPRFLQCPTFPLNAITFGRPLSRFPGALSCFVATEHSHTATSCCTHGSVGFAWIRCSRLRSSCTRSRRRVNKQYCMRTAYVGAVRIRIPRRGLVVGTSIESGSRHYRLLFAEDDFFSTTLCVFVFHPPAFYHLSLVHSLSLSLYFHFCLDLCLYLCSILSVNNSKISPTSSLHIHQIPSPGWPVCPRSSFQGNRLVIPLRRAKQSSKHRVNLSPRWDSVDRGGHEQRLLPLLLFPRVTFLARSCSPGNRVGPGL